MLASFSTSKTAGTGSNQDHLDIDELWCIYDKGLSSLTINGTQNNTAKNYFNAQEYLTHEPARTYDGNGNPSFNNSGSASWNYTNLVCYTSDSDFPQIDARPKSKLITNFVITQATMANHQATITVTHNDNSTYTYTIVFTNAHPKPTVTLNNGGTYTACAGVQIDVTASGASSYEWSNNLGNTATVHPTASGQYTVTGTSSGCSANAIAYVTVNERPEVKINGAVSGTASICSGNNATLTASGATTYQWSNNLGSATSINVSTGGTYTVTGTANGCSNTASVTVTAYDAPTVTINGSANGSTTACSTDAITLTASGASTYVWANNLGTNPAIQPPMSNSGDYTVTGTDSHGCTASATHHLTVNTTPTVNITGTTAICEGTSTTLTATSDWENTIFQWSNNLGTNAAVLVSAGGIYTVTGTKDGCSSSATVTVTESSLPDAPTVTPASRCGAGTVTLTVSSNEGTIHWYASETTQSESGTGTSFTTPNINNNTTYYVEVHSDAGCKSARVPVTATVNALPNVTATSAATNNAVCAGSSTTLTANGASSYVWSTNETGTTITVTPTANTTTYNVTGTGANGCENTATVTVTVNPVPGVPTPGQTTYCKGTTNVTLEATAGENGNALRWRTSPTGNATQGANYSANAVGTYYVSTYNTTNQCESEQVTITVAATPAAPAASPVTLCTAGQATLAVNNPNSDMTYTWYSNAALTTSVDTGATVDVTVSQDSTYYVTAQADGCESAATTVNVTIGDEIAAPTLTTPIYACGGSATLPATDGTHTLTWKSNGTVMTDYNVSIASGSATYTATYEVNGCESQPATVTVTYEAVPTISATGNDRCGAGVVTLNATSDGTIYWFTTQNAANAFTGTGSTYVATGTSYAPSINGTTTYYLRAISAGGCLSEVTTAVATLKDLPNVTATAANSAVCAGSSTTLTAGGANTYVWSTNETGATITVTPTTNTTTYTVTGTHANGCENTAAVTVTMNPVPGVPTPGQTTYCKGSGNVTLEATVGENGNALRWRTSPTGNATQGANYSANAVGTYYVSTYNTTNQCESEQVTITVAATPAAPAASPVTLCTAGQATLAVNNPNSDMTYTWYSNAALTTSVDTGATVDVTVSQDSTYYVTAQADGCESAATTVNVTIGDEIAAPTLTTPIYACGGSATLPATDGTHTLTWKSNGTVMTDYNVSIASGSATYTATCEVNGCESQPATVTVTYEAVPTISATGNERCGAGVVTLTASSTGDIYWFATQNAANAFTGAGSTYVATGTSYAPSINGTTTYYLRAVSAGGCLSEVTTAVATVNVNNDNLSTQTVTNCGPTTVTLSATGSTNPLTWYLDAAGTQTLANTTVTVDETTTYHVASTDENGCRSSLKSLTVTILDVPEVPTVTAPAPQCLTGSNVQVTLEATAGNVSDHTQWYNASMTALTQNTYSARITTTTTYYVATIGANGCESEAVPVEVVVNTPPAAPVISDTSRCGEGEVTFTATPSTNIQYKWYDNNNTLLETTNGNYTTTVSTTTTFKVAAYNTETGCESAKTSVVATVNPLPLAPQTTPISHCGPATVTLAATSNNTMTWYSDAAGKQELASTTLEVSETTSFYVMATDQNQCHSDLRELVVTINEVPAAPTVPAPAAICGEGSAVLTATPASGCAIRWYNANNQQLAQGDSYTTPAVQTNTTYQATNVNLTTQCEGPATSVEVVVNTLPDAPVLTGDNICGAGDATLTANVVAGTTTTWYHDATLTNDIATGSTMTYPVAEPTTFYAVNTDNATNCVSVVASATAMVYPTYVKDFSATACVQYEWNGEIFTATGDYTRTLQTVNSCDSVVTLHLTINPIQYTDITVDECDSWTWNGQTYTESGDYIQTISSVVTGCDSVVTAHVTIRHTTTSQQQLTICDNEIPYIYAGTQITSAGVKTITLENQQGCDSVITLTVVVNPQPDVPTLTDANRCGAGNVTLQAVFGTNGTICRWYEDATAAEPFATGASNTANLTETTTYYVSSYNANTGCESARVPVTATINEVPAQPAVADVARCGSGSVTMTVDPANNDLTYRWYTNNTTTTSLFEGAEFTTNLSTTTNFFVEAYNATTTCKSARKQVTATMNTIPSAPLTTNVENCGADVFALQNMVSSTPNTTFRWYEDNTVATPLATANTYTTENVTASRSYFVSNYNEMTSCESPRREIQITINPVYEPTTIEDMTCQGAIYHNYGQNALYPQAGTYSLVLNEVSSHGCDSLVTLVLTVNPTSAAAYQDQVCAGEHYQGYGFDTTATMAGVYTLTHHNTNTFGCDSVTTLTLTVNPVKATTINTTICATASYNFNGQTLTNPGTYTANLQTVNGCDSIVTLNLSVAAEYRDTIVAHICEGAAYTQNGFNETVAGFYSQNLIATNGCDSVVVLNLIVHQLSTTNLNAEICEGESYVANGFNVTPEADGLFTYQQVVPTSFGCDSTVNLTLTVHPVYHIVEKDTVCANQTYVWNGHDIDFEEMQPDTYIFHDDHQTIDGCDSNYTLHLTVLPYYHESLVVTLCDNDPQLPYMFAGEALNVSGHYVHNFHTLAGCDSIVELDLTINPTYQFEQTVSVCDNELPYVWNNRPEYTYHQAGEYTINLQTTAGCDSVWHLTLIVNPTYEEDTIITVCQGALPYAFDATHSFSEAGSYDVALTSQYGCDSIWHVQFRVQPYARRTESVTICADALPYVYDADNSFDAAGVYDIMETQADGCNTVVTLTLNVNPTYLHYDTVVACANTLPYDYDGMLMDAAGTYTKQYQSQNGCDSTVMVTLQVLENPTGATTEYVCSDDFPYEYAGENFAEAGTYNLVFETTGCDSLVTLTIVEVPVYQYEEIVETCEDALPYLWHGQSLVETGTYTDEHVSVYGCDSIYTLSLVVSDVKRSYETASICDNESYQWHQMTLSTDGIYLDTLSTLSGCDSICQLTLTVNPTYHNEQTLVVCQSSDLYYYVEADTLLDVSLAGDKIITFNRTSVNGCDSITTLTLVVNPAYSFEESQSVCVYDLPYEWHGLSLSADGTYYDSLHTVNGCDSVYALTLTVKPSNVYVSEPVDICQGETHAWRGLVIAESGVYRDTVTNAQGCYDIYEIEVTINPTYLFVDTVTVCDDELPYLWRNRTLTTAGTYNANYQTVSFCDSIYRLVLLVNPTYSYEETQTLCSDDVPYIWHGQSLTETGVYYDSLQTAAGCDSVYTLTLTVNSSYHIGETMTICASEAPYNWHGQSLTATGVYYDSLQTAVGCDSIYTLSLTVNPTYSFSETASACSYDLPYSWRGRSLTASGVYYDSLATTNGCDSIYVLTLTVNQSQVFTDPLIELCAGTTQTWRGHSISEAGEYRDTVMNTTGCYDIYVVNALVHPTYHFYDTMTVCQSTLPYEWGGHIFNTAETYTLNLQTSNGCDSIREYTLLVNPTYNYEETQTLCSDDMPYIWHGQSLTETGVYYDSLQTAAGCDSVYTLTLTVNPTNHQYDTAAVCSSELPYLWRGQQLNATGHYTDTIPNSYGCSDIFELQLTVNQTQLTTLYDTICQGYHYAQYGFDTIPATYGIIQLQSLHTSMLGCDSTVTLLLTVNRTYLFTTEASTCDNQPYEWRGHMFDTAGVYYETFTTVSGCDSVYMLSLTTTPTYEIFVQDTAMRMHEYVGYGLTVMPLDSGVYEYDIQNYTIDGCDSIVHLTLYVQFNDGVEHYTVSEPEFKLYPNPTTTFVNIEGEDMQRVYVYNSIGKLMMVAEADSDTHTRLEFVNYPAGYYVVRIELADGRTIQKKMVIRR